LSGAAHLERRGKTAQTGLMALTAKTASAYLLAELPGKSLQKRPVRITT